MTQRRELATSVSRAKFILDRRFEVWLDRHQVLHGFGGDLIGVMLYFAGNLLRLEYSRLSVLFVWQGFLWADEGLDHVQVLRTQAKDQ